MLANLADRQQALSSRSIDPSSTSLSAATAVMGLEMLAMRNSESGSTGSPSSTLASPYPTVSPSFGTIPTAGRRSPFGMVDQQIHL